MKRIVASAALVVACALYTGPVNAIVVGIISQDASDFSTLPADVLQTAPNFAVPGIDVIVNQTGSVAGQWRSPFENAAAGFGAGPGVDGGFILPGGYDLHYITIQANASATYDLSLSPFSFNRLSLLWGSPDDYNSISFCTGIAGGVVSGCSTPFIGGSPPGDIETYGHNQITLGTDVPFVAVLLKTGQNAFEYANLTAFCSGPECAGGIAGEVPLPGALPLFVSALACGGLLFRKRRKPMTAG
jgi:hypothetical protein